MTDGETFTIATDPLDGMPIDLPAQMRARKTARQIIQEVAAEFGVTADEMTGPRRFKRLVAPRRAAMIRIREELAYSFPKIGRIFGGRDHTSIIWNVRGGRKGQPPRTQARQSQEKAA